MSVLKRAWDLSGWIIGGYTLYKQLQSISAAKDDFYGTLSAGQQAQWDSIFGKPSVVQNISSLSLPPVKMPQAAVTPADHLTAGT